MTTTPQHRWSIRALLLVLLVPTLSIGLAFSATPAQAFAPSPGPIKIGEAIRAVPAGTVVKTGGRFLPWVRAGMTALSLFQVGANFLPLPEGAKDPNAVGEEVTSPLGCGVSMSNLNLGDRFVAIDLSWSGCFGGGNMGPYLALNAARCLNPGGTPKYTPGNLPFPGVKTQNIISSSGGGDQGNARLTSGNICPEGSTLDGVQIRGAISGAPEMGSTGWLPIGNPIPAEEYTYRTEVECVVPPYSNTRTITQTVTGGDLRKIPMPSCEEEYPGSTPISGRVKGGAPNVVNETLYEFDVDEGKLWRDYPSCFSDVTMKCTMRVFVDGQPCTFGAPGCGYWQERTSLDPSRTVECRWGPYVVPLGNCEPLRRAYRKVNPGAVTSTGPNGEPETTHDPDPRDLPEPGTGTGPGTSTPTGPAIPDTGTNPETPPVTGTPATPEGAESASCWGQGWSWNPVSWVFVPVKCALSWAFVPNGGAVDAAVGDVAAEWRGSSPYLWGVAVTGLVPGGVSGCEGLPLDVDLGYGVSVHERIGAACSGGMADAAALCRAALSAAVVIGGGFACVRALGSGLGWSPGVGKVEA